MLVMSLLFVGSHTGDWVPDHNSAPPTIFDVAISLYDFLLWQMCSVVFRLFSEGVEIHTVFALVCRWEVASSGSSCSAIFPLMITFSIYTPPHTHTNTKIYMDTSKWSYTFFLNVELYFLSYSFPPCSRTPHSLCYQFNMHPLIFPILLSF